MNNPTIKSEMQNTYHRDGTVSYWSVFARRWLRADAGRIDHQDLAAMSASEREKITCLATGQTPAELAEIRREAQADREHDRLSYAGMTQAERDAHDNL